MRTRPHHISVWMNDQEYQHLKKQAQEAGMGTDPSSAIWWPGCGPPQAARRISRPASGAARHRREYQPDRPLGQRPEKSISEADIRRVASLAEQAWRLVKEAL